MKPHVQDAITELCRADYHLATAATVLEQLQLAEPQGNADKLMRECIALREQLSGDRNTATRSGFRVTWAHAGGTGNAFCVTREEAEALASQCRTEGCWDVMVLPAKTR